MCGKSSCGSSHRCRVWYRAHLSLEDCWNKSAYLLHERGRWHRPTRESRQSDQFPARTCGWDRSCIQYFSRQSNAAATWFLGCKPQIQDASQLQPSRRGRSQTWHVPSRKESPRHPTATSKYPKSPEAKDKSPNWDTSHSVHRQDIQKNPRPPARPTSQPTKSFSCSHHDGQARPFYPDEWGCHGNSER